MTRDRSNDMALLHQEVSALIPWYVNGTLGGRERRKLDAHLRTCSFCRDDLALEQRIHQGISATQSGVDYIPAASLKRLHAQVDHWEVQRPVEEPATEGTPAPAMRRPRWQAALAASVAVAAVAAGLVAGDRWMTLRAGATPVYYTVTTADPRSPEEVIRAVFAPSLTLVELQALLDEAQLRIISGPTEAGVYSLAAKSTRPVGSSLALLRRHPTVRFAEGTRADLPPAPSP